MASSTTNASNMVFLMHKVTQLKMFESLCIIMKADPASRVITPILEVQEILDDPKPTVYKYELGCFPANELHDFVLEGDNQIQPVFDGKMEGRIRDF